MNTHARQMPQIHEMHKQMSKRLTHPTAKELQTGCTPSGREPRPTSRLPCMYYYTKVLVSYCYTHTHTHTHIHYNTRFTKGMPFSETSFHILFLGRFVSFISFLFLDVSLHELPSGLSSDISVVLLCPFRCVCSWMSW